MSDTSTQDNQANPVDLDEEEQRLDRMAKMLIGRDFELQKAYDSLEQAFNQLAKEKRDLQIEKNKLSLVFGSITDGIFALDQKFNIVAMNKVAEQITGYPEAEALGKSFNDIVSMIENDTVINSIILYHGKGDARGVIAQKDGIKVTGRDTAIYANVQSARIVGGEGVNVGFIVTIHDLTAQRQLEEMKLDFVSMAAHELRTPLTAIKGYLDLISRSREDPEASQSFINQANSNAAMLGNLINNLLSLSRIERNALPLNKELLNWTHLVLDVVSSNHFAAEDKSLTLDSQVPEEAIHLSGDAMALKEVINNLISNAIHYTDPGGHITVTVTKSATEVTTTVKDTGIGVSEAALDKLFTKYFRAKGGLTTNSQGTGIGLFISKTMVEAHGGTIGVRSTVGQGSEFYFTLPLTPPTDHSDDVTQGDVPPVEPPASDVPVSPQAETPVAGTHKILIVEDYADIARIYSFVLEKSGYTVQVATDGKMALQKVLEFAPDLVLLDIMIPLLDGVKVLQAIKSDPQYRHHIPKVIIMSNLFQQDIADQTKDLGADGYVVKANMQTQNIVKLVAEQLAPAA